MSLETLIKKTREQLVLSQFKEALKSLKSHHVQYQNNVEFLQLFGEVYLENGKVEKAYEILERACELDFEGQYGSEKFFQLGQIVGGGKGLEFIDHGIAQLTSKLEANPGDLLTLKKLTQGIHSEIEIWMTDLCMEQEAEDKCNELIQQALTIDELNPESWSVLASIRISQQRDEEALEAINKSWGFFAAKKSRIEDAANKIIEVDNIEYVELIQPLLTLSRFSIELGNYELGSIIAQSVRDIDEDNVESYYLEGLGNYLYVKKAQYDIKYQSYDPELFEQLQVQVSEEFKENIDVSKINLTKVIKISEREEIDQDIKTHSEQILNEVGGILEEGEDEIDEEHWEDIIESDNE